MKSNASLVPSRASSSSNLSKTTALDVPHHSADLHHTHLHKNSDATETGTLKDPLYPSKDKAASMLDSEPIQVSSLSPDDDQNINSNIDGSDESEKGQDHRHSLQLPDETGNGEDHGLGWTCTWNDLPQWMRDNPAIITGYRRATFSYYKCVRSLGYLHNETVNIWSHLLGAIGFVIVTPIAYFKVLGVLDTIRWTDIAVLYAFLAGAIMCLSMSASFHTFSCHSEKACSQWIRCDYLGIVFLIVGSFYPAIFYAFYCHKTLQIVYISIISTLGAATIIAVMQPRFRSPQYRWVRSALFLGIGLSGLAPIIHGIIIYGFAMAQQAIALNYMFCMGASYVFGALIYGSRIPECFFPGKFDHFMASHQIFHVCVVLGCVIHCLGVVKAMTWWHENDHSCTIPLDQMRAMFVS